MKNFIRIPLVLLLFLALGCSKDDNEVPVVVKSDAKAIISFSFNAVDNTALNENLTTSVTEASKTVSGSVPSGIDVTALTPTIEISTKASISPTGAQDFSSPVSYTVTAEDGSKATYSASVMIMASDAKQIVSFVFTAEANNAISEDIAGEIDETEKTIALTLPSGTDITTLSPTIEIPENASIDPSGPVDFSESVTYTVTAEDGSTIEYAVSVVVTISQKDALIAIFNANPNNRLSWIFADEIDTWSGVRVNEEGMVSQLFLSGARIDVIPPEIGVLTALIELDAASGSLKGLPNEIGLLTNLTKLDLGGSPIEMLPQEIGELSNLVELNLKDHKLTNLPSSIGRMINLEVLELDASSFSSNEEDEFGLTTLPAEIGQLTKLRYLSLDENNITDLPAEIGSLGNLVGLNARRNKLSSLPREIGLMSSLEGLRINGNNLTEIPIEIGQLVNLTNLDISDNQLTELRTQIGNLPNLRSLLISNNPIQFIPSSFGSGFRNSLSSLHLVGLQLTRIPNWVFDLRNLNGLFLSNNSITAIPNEINRLNNLRQLLIGNNQLTVLPEELWELTELVNLFVNDNQLTELSIKVGELTEMTFLQFGDNQITSVPNEISRLNKLSNLWFANNLITSVPAEVCALEETGTRIIKDNIAICED